MDEGGLGKSGSVAGTAWEEAAQPQQASGRKVSAFDIGTSPSSSSPNTSCCAPPGVTHLNSSSTPSEASVLAGSTRIQGLRNTTPVRMEVHKLLDAHARSQLSSAGGGWRAGSLLEGRLQMSAESSQGVEAPPLCPSISSPSRVTLSRSAVHVTILFRQLKEPRETSRAPEGRCFARPLPRRGRRPAKPSLRRAGRWARAPGRASRRRSSAALAPGWPLRARWRLPSAETLPVPTTCGSPSPGGEGGPPAGGGQFRPASRSYINKPWRGQEEEGEDAAGRGLAAPSLRGAALARPGLLGPTSHRQRYQLPHSSHPRGARPETPEEKSPALAGLPRFVHGAGGSAASRDAAAAAAGGRGEPWRGRSRREGLPGHVSRRSGQMHQRPRARTTNLGSLCKTPACLATCTGHSWGPELVTPEGMGA
ncbi:uncharacterized protein LOC132692955 [Panthera onca]